MGNTRENETVAGSENSIYADQGGYGPGPELKDKEQKPMGRTSFDAKSVGVSRQEADPTILSHDLEPDEGKPQK